MASSNKLNAADKLKNLRKSEILEMLERQKTLLANKKFVARLPDRGEKIRRQKDRLEKALAKHAVDVDETSDLFQRLKLGRPKVQDNQDLDSDDDAPEYDSWQQQETAIPAKVAPTRDEPARIKNEAITGQDAFVDKLTQRLEPESGRPAHLTYHFRLNSARELRTTRTTGQVPKRDEPKRWFETAVTPPPSKFDEARLISLKDSLELRKRQEETLKELAIIHAAEQLTSRTLIKTDSSLRQAYRTEFRDGVSEDRSSEEED